MTLLSMDKVELQGKVVLIRKDFNVLLHGHGQERHITDDSKIRAAIPGIQQALKKGAKTVILMSHLGAPVEGEEHNPDESLDIVATKLTKLLGQEVVFVREWLGKTKQELASLGPIILLENVRFNVGEKENNVDLSKKMASLCDVFVMDALTAAHREEASTCGVAAFAPVACAGPLLFAEVAAISKIMKNPEKPVVAVIGGSKCSSKLKLIESMIDLADSIIVVGGVANTFIAAAGHGVAESLYEPDLIDEAQRLVDLAEQKGHEIIIPIDVMVGDPDDKHAEAADRFVSQLTDSETILDIGADSAKRMIEIIKKAGTILWSGSLGFSETEQCERGTKILLHAIDSSSAYTLAGGADTIRTIEKYGAQKSVDYISAAGGAFLEMLQNVALPAVQVLEFRAKKASV